MNYESSDSKVLCSSVVRHNLACEWGSLSDRRTEWWDSLRSRTKTWMTSSSWDARDALMELFHGSQLGDWFFLLFFLFHTSSGKSTPVLDHVLQALRYGIPAQIVVLFILFPCDAKATSAISITFCSSFLSETSSFHLRSEFSDYFFPFIWSIDSFGHRRSAFFISIFFSHSSYFPSFVLVTCLLVAIAVSANHWAW